MSQPPQFDQLKALIDVNNDLRRELDAANKLIKELFEENDKLTLKILNMKARVTALLQNKKPASLATGGFDSTNQI